MRKNLLYFGIFACTIFLTACSKEELSSGSVDAIAGEVQFYGAIKKQSEILATTRATEEYITLNETGQDFGTFYIWMKVGSDNSFKSFFQPYKEAPGEQGNLVIDSEKQTGETEPLNWYNETSDHIFYAWTQPSVSGDNNEITGGVKMNQFQYGEQLGTTEPSGIVIYGTNKETDLEKFIITQKGPIFYDEWGQDVALYFERPIAKITLLGVIYIDANGAENANIQTCTLLFPNMYKTASFNPFLWNDNGTQNVLSTDNQKKGIKWEWHKTVTTEHDAKSLYVHPFQFGSINENTNQSDDNTGIHQDPGFFIIQMAFDGGSTKSYTGTLNSLNLTPTSATAKRQLNAGEHMQLYLTVTDGGGVGIGYQIIDWNTEEEQTLPQYRIPGVYNEEDAGRLLEALQKAADISTYPNYNFPEGVEDLVVKTSGDNVTLSTYDINLFTHVDWSKVTTAINIPNGYTLNGNGYNVTLGDSGSITGQRENIYIDGKYVKDSTSSNTGGEDSQP